ncbi:MAG: hypothetical protein WKF88_06415 [Ferruginibacter sp.]
MLSEFYKEVSEAYGAIYESFSVMLMKGVGKRAAFIIDQNGLIQYAEVLEKAQDLPDFALINAKLESLS